MSPVTRAALLAAALLSASCARPAPPPPNPSVLLITIDTLRADRVGCYGDREARTPTIDALAAAGVRFERAYTPAPLTLPAHASLFTGLLPPAHGVRGNGSFALPAGPATLAEVLRARGLATGAFVGAFPLARRFGLGRGFDEYDDAFARAPGLHYDFAERPGAEVVGAARRWLERQHGPVFLWVHLFEPHAPYEPPPAFRGRDPYRGEIAAADAALAPLVAAWDARAGASLVALVSDHGEAFGEHGEESHGLFVYDVTLHVPLVLRGASLPTGARVAVPVGTSDLAATLADAVGGTAPLPGVSLLPLARGAAVPARPLYAETLAPRLDFGWSDLRSWRDGRYKYIRAPRPELYDLESDPGESHDLARERPREAAALKGALEAAAARREAAARRPADAEAAERLRALGYVQAPEVEKPSGLDPKDRVEVARAIARAAGPFADYRAAVAAYEPIARRAPEVPVVSLRLADALLRSGRPADAQPYYERVIAAGPRRADAHVGLATALAELGRLDAARRVLEQGLAVEPQSGQVHYNLGEIARVRGRREEARARYRAALDDAATHERAALRLREMGP